MCGGGGGIGTIVGAAIGFALGGLPGASIGATIGGTAGGMLAPPEAPGFQAPGPPPDATSARNEADEQIRSAREASAARSGTSAAMRGTLLTGPSGVTSMTTGKTLLGT